MISWISSWAQGIIMAVIIGAIIEMILPEGNSKKYVKIVIGVYVLFTIISPVISKITGKTIQVSDILELNKYIEETENNSKLYVTLDEDNSNNIKDIYESSLRNDIKAKIEAKGYNAKNIKLEIEDDEEYTLKKIDIEIYKNMEKNKKDIETIQNVDINISQKSTENDMQEKLSEKDKRKLKDYLSGVYEIDEKNNNKKTIENLVVFIIILIIVLLSINIIWGKDKKENNKNIEKNNRELAISTDKESEDKNILTSKNLEDILSKINGVGKVKVYITYSQTSQIIPMYNEDISQKDTQEADTQGGTRKVVETDTKKEIVYDEKSGTKTIITQSIVSPKIEGAIITAEGGNNTNTKANIIQAVEAVTGLPTHKIQVFEMEKTN